MGMQIPVFWDVMLRLQASSHQGSEGSQCLANACNCSSDAANLRAQTGNAAGHINSNAAIPQHDLDM